MSLLGQGRPGSVTLAAGLQALLAVTFLVMPILGDRHGGDAQAAAEAEVERQAFPADLLARNKVHFDEGAVGLVLPVAIALCLAALAVLNLEGVRGRGYRRLPRLVPHRGQSALCPGDRGFAGHHHPASTPVGNRLLPLTTPERNRLHLVQLPTGDR